MPADPSPIVLVDGNPTTDGNDVADLGHIVIQLADLGGVSEWSLECISTDDFHVASDITAQLSVDSVTKTATWDTLDTAGNGFTGIFRSRVNRGVDLNGRNRPDYSTTFALFIRTGVGSLRKLALNQATEGSAAFGWIVEYNELVAVVASASTAQATAATPGTLALRGGAGETAFAFVNLGSGNLAGAGEVRLSNAGTIRARNAANAADLTLLSVGGSDTVTLGGPATVADVLVGGSSSVTISGHASASTGLVVSTATALLSGVALKFGTTDTPSISQGARGGTGANAGAAMSVTAQPGQAQSGGAANNNGGSLTLSTGVAGTGGSGAAGAVGVLQLKTGATVRVQAGPTGLALFGGTERTQPARAGQIATADASDLATAIALANATKAAYNTLEAKISAAGTGIGVTA